MGTLTSTVTNTSNATTEGGPTQSPVTPSKLKNFELVCAFSRQNPNKKKVYVQDKMHQNAAKIRALLLGENHAKAAPMPDSAEIESLQPRGCAIICGGTGMGAGANDALTLILGREA